jgi:protein phosphatase
VRFAAGNAQDIGHRSEQQDAFGFSDPQDAAFVSHGGFMGVVADGMGGMAGGSAASEAAVRAFRRAYLEKSPAELIPDALARSLREANAAVVSLAAKEPSQLGVGTTLVAAVLHRGLLHWVSVGDSRIYLLRVERATQLTADHIYSRELYQRVIAGEIPRSRVLSDPQRDSLTSYLGQPDLKAVDRNQKPFALLPGDRVVLCSDGLYRAMSEAEIASALRGVLQEACQSLVAGALAKQRPNQDNLTIIALGNDNDASGGTSEKDSWSLPGPSWVWMTSAGLVLVAVIVSLILWWRSATAANANPAGKAVTPGLPSTSEGAAPANRGSSSGSAPAKGGATPGQSGAVSLPQKSSRPTQKTSKIKTNRTQ